MSNWLITGGCGFIGRSLIQVLLQQGGHGVRVLDNLSVGRVQDLADICPVGVTNLRETPTEGGLPWPSPEDRDACQVLIGDIRNQAEALAATRGAEVVLHAAANTGVPASVDDPRKDREQNVEGIFNMLEAGRAAGVRRFIFCSSGAVLGEVTPPIHEEMVPHPVSPYGASKLAGEAYCSAYWRSYGLETVALRFGNVYGPNSKGKDSVVAKLLKRALAGEEFKIYGDGSQTRDFIYIYDLVQAILAAAQAPGAGGQVFQIAAGREVTINELVDMTSGIMKELDYPPLALGHGQKRRGDVPRNYFDVSKAERILGWEPRTELRQGLRKTARWFLDT